MVVRARNEARDIGRTLDSVLAQTVPVDVLVIANGSTDATVDEAEQRGVRVHVMRTADFTFGRACNLGLELTDTPFVIFLSAHAWPVATDWVARLLEPFDDESVAGTHGRQDPIPGQDPVRAAGQRRAFAVDASGASEAHFSNANSAVRRRAWEDVCFDESLPGAEDFAWAQAQARAGKRVVYVPGAAVFHSHRESLRAVFLRHRREAAGLLETGAPSGSRYLRDWARWSRAESRALLRAGEVRWALWAPLYFGARFGGDYLGRRRALRAASPHQRWQAGLADEVRYWRDWITSGGAEWPDDFRRRFDPEAELQVEVRRLLPEPTGEVVRILDVGSGPASWLGRRWAPHHVELTAVDPLAQEWARLLDAHALVPPVPAIQGEGERLRDLFPEGHFDIAMARYSLDESHDPVTVLRQMLAVVKPGGAVVISSRVRAADSESRWGLQQWNLDVQGGRVSLDGHGRRVDLGEAMAADAVIEEATVEPRQWLWVVFRRV